uniref:Sodium channel protein Nach n=1 Tax=Glossina pallidipes TaxID=7398 RepID=A0A1A9ZBM3_GLOPL
MVDIKTTSSAVWWIKYPQQQQQQQAEHTQSRAIRLCQDMTDLFSNISLHGYNKLFDSELLLYEKLIWLCLHITTFVVMIIILSFTWDYFVAQYFAINLHDPLYPVEKIAFPAISICSNNRISYQAAENYAIELYRQRLHDQRFGRSDAGLTVIVNSSQVNDVVSLLNMNAYVVIIHKASNFPDIASGEAIEVFPIHNEETFVAIKARVMNTSEKLRIFSSVYRKCLFNDETPKKDLLLHHSYSFANCITKCRIQSIKALCNCVPFYTPLEYLGNKDGVVYCTLKHVACMDRYNFKWRNVLTQTVTNIPGLESEAEEALYCPQCMPSCNDIQYQVSMMSLPTDRFWLQENSQYRRQYTLHSYGRFVGRSL